jgi:DNA-binding XRE family transcriptional regulator
MSRARNEERWRDLGRAVFERRRELGMRSQADLAKLAGVHVNTISKLERGVISTRPNPSWPAIEAALGWRAGFIRGYLGFDRVELSTAGRLAMDDPVAVIERAVVDQAAQVAPEMSVRQAREFAARIVEQLREYGLIPPTAGRPERR